jgi:hypothetical protein
MTSAFILLMAVCDLAAAVRLVMARNIAERTRTEAAHEFWPPAGCLRNLDFWTPPLVAERVPVDSVDNGTPLW